MSPKRSRVYFISVLSLVMLEGLHARNVGRSVSPSRPDLSSDRLHEIREYDRMKCFPKILCSLTKSGAFIKLGHVSLNDLADGYLRLLTAFPGGPPSNLKESRDELPSFSGQSSSLSKLHDEEEDEVPSGRRDEESEELLLSDPMLHHKERLEMKKLMAELIAEEKAESLKKPSGWASSAMSIPLKIGSSLLKGVVLPLLVGDSRRKRDIDIVSLDSIDDKEGIPSKLQDPLGSAMKRWNKLKSPQQCSKVYPSCPFEAWEIVSMIKLIKDSTKRNLN